MPGSGGRPPLLSSPGKPGKGGKSSPPESGSPGNGGRSPPPESGSPGNGGRSAPPESGSPGNGARSLFSGRESLKAGRSFSTESEPVRGGSPSSIGGNAGKESDGKAGEGLSGNAGKSEGGDSTEGTGETLQPNPNLCCFRQVQVQQEKMETHWKPR